MIARLRLGIAVACAALAAAACDGANAFTGTTFGTSGSPVGGTGSIQGQVTVNGSGQGGIPVVLIDRDSTVTTGAGVFAFDSVPSGTYQVAVRAPIGLTLAAGQTSQRSVVVTNGATSGVTFILQGSIATP